LNRFERKRGRNCAHENRWGEPKGGASGRLGQREDQGEKKEHVAHGPPYRRFLQLVIGGARLTLIALACAALAGSASQALALKIPIAGFLSGAGEVPANGSPAKGLMEGTFDTDTNTLTWTVTYSGLSSPVIAAHFHGPVSYLGLTPEENAPIQVAISPARSTVSPSSAPTRQRTSRTGAGT